MADDKPSKDDEPAPVAAAEKPGAAEKKTKKKKKKKTSKGGASAAGASETGEAVRKKKKKTSTKKKRPASSSSPPTTRPRSDDLAAKGGRGGKGDDDNTLALGVGAVVVAVLAVGVVWWMKNDGSDGAESLEAVETTTEATAADPAETEVGQPPVERPGPEPIPAPPDVAAPPEGAERTESGIASRVLEEGEGTEHPGPSDRVTVHYTGWTTDGEMFDSSIRRGRPATFPLDGVIPGWTEGVQLMVQGEKRRFWIPADLAYEGRPGPQGTLVFDIELLEFEETPEPPPAPENVAAPPPQAERTESGLASMVLEEGDGTEHPEATSRVRVHYTGWTTDGEMFDSSVTRGRPATFPLNGVIPGWTEGVQLMVEGEKRRFWIPEDLAYAGRPGAPQGMLVFDVELLEIL